MYPTPRRTSVLARLTTLRAGGALVLLTSAASLGAQGVGSTLQTTTKVERRVGTVGTVFPASCNTIGGTVGTAFGGVPAATALSTCAVPATTRASTTVYAATNPTASFDPNNPGAYQLTDLKTTASVTSEGRRYPGNNAPVDEVYPPAVTATAFASFTDYLLLGVVRPNSLKLSFELTGSLAVDPLFGASGAVAEASLLYSVGAQSGRIFDSQFSSLAEYAYGDVYAERRVTSYTAGTAVNTVVRNDDGAFAFSELDVLGTTRVSITLGNRFFSNPANDVILLNLGLFSRPMRRAGH